jgi:threonine dehydrogenase-like Zn-dependent dehydrogenase
VNFEKEDPIAAIRELTQGIGVDRVIDAVGVDANRPHHGPASRKGLFGVFGSGSAKKVKGNPSRGNWEPGDAPSQALQWAVESIAKAGTLSIIGVYGEVDAFPIGDAMEKNLTIKMGNCNHRKYIPRLLDLVRAGVVNPAQVLTQVEPMTDVIEAYKLFDRRTPGWVKVMLEPQAVRRAA